MAMRCRVSRAQPRNTNCFAAGVKVCSPVEVTTVKSWVSHVARTARSVAYVLFGAAALWSCTIEGDLLDDGSGTDEAVGVAIVGEGTVQFSDSSGGTPEPPCTNTCSYDVDNGVDFTLTAADGTDAFAGWVCYSDGQRTAPMNPISATAVAGASRDCIATFGTVHELAVTIDREPADLPGLGQFTFQPGMFRNGACQDLGGPGDCTCESSCELFVKHGEVLEISSNTAAVGISRTGGECTSLNFAVTGDVTSCEVLLSQPRLTVDVTGNGRVTSDPIGVDCQGTGPSDPDAGACSEVFALGQQLTLTAEPNVGAQFVQWLESCNSSGPVTAQVTLVDVTMPTRCTAEFSGGLVVGQAGVVELVSVGESGGNLASFDELVGNDLATRTLDLSSDGRTVAFLGQTPSPAVKSYYVRDVVNDVTRLLAPANANFGSDHLSVSGDGRFVAFAVHDAGLNAMLGLPAVPGSTPRVFVADVEAGTVALVSDDDPANGINVWFEAGYSPAISDNGRWVAFVGNLEWTNQVGNVLREEIHRVLVRDTCAGVPDCQPSTVVASATAAGELPVMPNTSFENSSLQPALSADGRYLAYRSNALLLATDGPGQVPQDGVDWRYHILLRDRDADADGTFDDVVTQRVVSLYRTPQGVDFTWSTTERPAISADGRFVVYSERAPELLAEEFSPIQRYDSCAGEAVGSCSPKTDTVRGSEDDFLDSGNTAPDISADGRYVSMVGQTPLRGPTIFVRDTCLDTPDECDSQARTPVLDGSGNTVSSASASLGGDGRAVAFTTGVPLPDAGDLGFDNDAFLAQTGFVPPAALQPAIVGVVLEGVPFGAAAGHTMLPAGADELLITVFGESFAPGARVRFDGVDVRTIFAGADKLQFRAVPGAPRSAELSVFVGVQSATVTVNVQ